MLLGGSHGRGRPLVPPLVRHLVVTALVAIGTVAGAAATDTIPLRPASFIPHWLPQAQFAGYYVAYDQGLYRSRGIDLTILTGGPDRPASEWLDTGKADFATLWLSTAIQMRARGAPIVNLAQMLERSSLMLIAKKSSGISVPSDMRDKKVGVWGGDFLLQPLAFFKRNDLSVQAVPIAGTINLFLRDGVEVTVAMWYNEYHTILSSGIDPDELTTFFFHEQGLNFPEDGIYCREHTLRADPALARGFVQASLEGWQYAFAHPDEAVDVVMKYMAEAHIGTNAAHQRWMLDRMRDLIVPPDAPLTLGTLRRADYDLVAQTLKDNGWITEVPDFTAFHQPLATAP
jgi:NitT/TauT family transport system substrate-binding protein